MHPLTCVKYGTAALALSAALALGQAHRVVRGILRAHVHVYCARRKEGRGEPDVFCARTYIARAEKRGGGEIRLVYLDRFLCVKGK